MLLILSISHPRNLYTPGDLPRQWRHRDLCQSPRGPNQRTRRHWRSVFLRFWKKVWKKSAALGGRKVWKNPRKYEKSPKKYKQHLKSTEKCEKNWKRKIGAEKCEKKCKKCWRLRRQKVWNRTFFGLKNTALAPKRPPTKLLNLWFIQGIASVREL